MLSFSKFLLPITVSGYLSATLSAQSAFVDFEYPDQAGAFSIDYSITNNGVETVEFFPWHTPLDGVWEDLFDIVDQRHQKVEYEGKEAHRKPTFADLVQLAPGESLHAYNVDLSDSYFLPKDGTYAISLRQPEHTHAPHYSVTADPIFVTFHDTYAQAPQVLAKRNQVASFSPGNDAQNKVNSFSSCTRSQRDHITRGYNTAWNVHIPQARNCMSGSLCSAYSTWFGTVTSTRRARVAKCWDDMRRDLPKANFVCCEGCGSNCGGSRLWAYVYPTDRQMRQYMCGAFFASNVDADLGSTVTHEQSHFRATCSTNRYDPEVYGRSAGRDLARRDPVHAHNNANNFEYFGVEAR
jgi:peptidyl-Lys metalloendopeptidase